MSRPSADQYLQHGLTREEDGILGGFGTAEILEEEVHSLQQFSSLEAVKSLIRKGLLQATVSEGLVVQLKLTPKGVKLWHVRSQEEADAGHYQ